MKTTEKKKNKNKKKTRKVQVFWTRLVSLDKWGLVIKPMWVLFNNYWELGNVMMQTDNGICFFRNLNYELLSTAQF